MLPRMDDIPEVVPINPADLCDVCASAPVTDYHESPDGVYIAFLCWECWADARRLARRFPRFPRW